MEQKAVYQFTLHELPITYNTDTKTFTCDKESVTKILYAYYPQIYAQLCKECKEIQETPVSVIPDANCKEQETKRKKTQVLVGKAPIIKPIKKGMFNKITCGLKKFIDKMTPKKYRKKIPPVD